MSILFDCKCGKPLKVKEEFAGKKIKCPYCGVLMTAPVATPAVAVAAAKEVAVAGGPSLHDEGAISIEDGPLDHGIRIEMSGTGSGENFAPTAAASVGAAAEPMDESNKRYKVVTTKELGFVSKFDSSKLEDALNQYAAKGWSVRTSMRITVQAHGGAHDELVFILER